MSSIHLNAKMCYALTINSIYINKIKIIQDYAQLINLVHAHYESGKIIYHNLTLSAQIYMDFGTIF